MTRRNGLPMGLRLASVRFLDEYRIELIERSAK
jgi:hypothetical protein